MPTVTQLENTIDMLAALDAISKAQKLADLEDTINVYLLNEKIAPADYVLLLNLIDAAVSKN